MTSIADLSHINRLVTATDRIEIETGQGRSRQIEGDRSRGYAALHPQVYVGDSYTEGDWNGVPGMLGIGGASVTIMMNAERIVFAPFIVKSRLTITAADCYVTTAIAATFIRLGIYNPSAYNGQPGTLAYDLGTVDSSTTGSKTITSLSCTLDPGGSYWVAAVSNGAPWVSVHRVMLPWVMLVDITSPTLRVVDCYSSPGSSPSAGLPNTLLTTTNRSTTDADIRSPVAFRWTQP